ncbi:putative proline-rich family protein [Tanacetum coccineum]
MVMMVPHEAFACPCGAGDVVLRESYRAKTRGKLYYACPKSKPRLNYYGCEFFLWKEERVRQLISSPGASSTPSFSPGTSSTPIFSPTPSTPPNYYGGSSSNTECSNCKPACKDKGDLTIMGCIGCELLVGCGCGGGGRIHDDSSCRRDSVNGGARHGNFVRVAKDGDDNASN